MSDFSYNVVWWLCYPPFWVSSSPVVLHADRARRPGAYILAPNHLSALDVPCVMAISPRPLDFLSIVEMGRKPFVGWFFSKANTFFVDRGAVDTAGVRIVLDRLGKGRVVAMFPEASIRTEATSVVNGGRFKPGVARLAHMADAPIVPCVILGVDAYRKILNWLPLRRVKYGVIFGEPVVPRKDLERAEAVDVMVGELKRAYVELYAELSRAMGRKTLNESSAKEATALDPEPARESSG
jgi:1-acyl-sn-glycerol-3-phosphate acyltransferase